MRFKFTQRCFVTGRPSAHRPTQLSQTYHWWRLNIKINRKQFLILGKIRYRLVTETETAFSTQGPWMGPASSSSEQKVPKEFFFFTKIPLTRFAAHATGTYTRCRCNRTRTVFGVNVHAWSSRQRKTRIKMYVRVSVQHHHLWTDSVSAIPLLGFEMLSCRASAGRFSISGAFYTIFIPFRGHMSLASTFGAWTSGTWPDADSKNGSAET